jgi:hypothetical protein
MPRNLQEVFDHADRLARQQGSLKPSLGALRRAVIKHAAVEKEIAAIVRHARCGGVSWREIGAVIGTSGEAARQRYGELEDD